MFDFLANLLKDPKALFVKGILSKWFLIITVPAITITYYFFKGLSDIGFIRYFEETLITSLNTISYVVKACTPKLTSLSEFIRCLQ